MHQNFDHIDHLERPLKKVRRRGRDRTAEITPPLPDRRPPCRLGWKRARPLRQQLDGPLLARRLSTPTDAYSGGVAEVVTG
jgi:hypothetical protein